MVTYREIQAYVQKKHGYKPKTCWIAHVKELSGFPMRRAPNRRSGKRVEPCPPGKIVHIREALEDFGLPEIKAQETRIIRGVVRELPALDRLPAPSVRRLLQGEVVARDEGFHYLRKEKPGVLRESPPASLRSAREEYAAARPLQPMLAPREEWFCAFTSDFRKTVDSVDKKLKGRILEAITEICKTPTTPRGDTIKPLLGELKGDWRYRIGDYRLIYRPDPKQRTVYLLAVFPRGSAYVD